jgi:glycosyltransferase involved in cell wall biosynthesis
MTSETAQPLVSVICFCKNRVNLIPRSIQSVLNQTYANWEFVVQDGASTDGTLELLQDYARRDSRIKIVSEPDSGPAEAYWKVMQRCEGDYIATCLSDEELVPDALEKCVRWFGAEPDLGAITCDGYVTDAKGQIINDFKAGEFDFVAYLFARYCPFWPGSFFRRQALIDIGLKRPGWHIGSLEFEFWCRLACDHKVKYVPEPISKYAIHPGQLSNTPANFNEHLDGRLHLIERLFSKDGFFGDDAVMLLEAKLNQLAQFHDHARAHGIKDEQEKFAERIRSLQKGLAKYVRRRAGIIFYTHEQRTQSWAQYIWMRIAFATPERLRRALPRWLKDAVQTLFVTILFFLRHPALYTRTLAYRLIEWASKKKAIQVEISTLPRSYPRVAQIYDSRGQIGEALEMWRRAESLDDPVVDGLACQAILKLPEATYASIEALQSKWAERHAKADARRPAPSFMRPEPGRKIRIGYHCSFMESDTIRYIMGRAIAAHDRSKFEVYSYAPTQLVHLKPAFDVTRTTGMMSDQKFVDLVRRDQIDVFVEMTGFSPGNRFAAMAQRCAPVQVSYLNHHGTSCVHNVDYILSDEICTPSNAGIERHFSERIYRLPNCLLCYDYEDSRYPPVAEPPSVQRGYVTFGCFGSGGKINTQLISWWAELLHRVPNAMFQIQNAQLGSPDNHRYMIDRFRRFGIESDRLVVRGGTDRQSLLKAYDEVDISLDTWPYCGGNTLAESLWQGVPVVTLKGSRFSTRYGASLLVAAGCGDLVGETPAEYLDLAQRLANDPERLRRLRAELRPMYRKHGIGDSTGFSRDLDRAYLEMLDEYWNRSGKTAGRLEQAAALSATRA